MVQRKPFPFMLLVAVPLFLLASGSARAIAIWPSMPGSWVGFSQSLLLPAVQLPAVQFGVTRQSKGRFTGVATVAMGDGSVRFFCDGSVQPNPVKQTSPTFGNVLNIAGLSSDGKLVVFIHGKTVAMGDGSVRIAALRYRIVKAFGKIVDQGYLLLLQNVGGINWGDLPAPSMRQNLGSAGSGSSDTGAGQGLFDWLGDWTSALYAESRAGLIVTGQRGTAFQGSLQPEPAPIPIPYPNLLRIVGTVGLPAVQDGTSRTVIIGSDTHGIIAVLIGLLLPAIQNADGSVGVPPTLNGDYTLFGSLADIYNGVWRGTDTSFDKGTYNLPAVQSTP